MSKILLTIDEKISVIDLYPAPTNLVIIPSDKYLTPIVLKKYTSNFIVTWSLISSGIFEKSM